MFTIVNRNYKHYVDHIAAAACYDAGMSDNPTIDLTLERVNRLTQAVADLMESHAAQGRNLTRALDRIEAHLGALTTEVRALASEQVLLGNRVENAFSRALRTNIRLDEIEDGRP